MVETTKDSGFNTASLHKRFSVIGEELKGWKVVEVVKVDRNPVFECICPHGHKKNIHYSQLTSKRDKKPRCFFCSPKHEPFSVPTSKYYPFYKLYVNVHKKNLRSKDFSDFHKFMNWILDILKDDKGYSAFRFDLNMRLVKRDSRVEHSKENTILVVKWSEDKEEEFFTKSKEIEA